MDNSLNSETITEILNETKRINNKVDRYAAIDYLKKIIIERDYRDELAAGCGIQILKLLLKSKISYVNDLKTFLLNVINDRILSKDFKYQYLYWLSNLYLEKKNYELGYKIANDAATQITEFKSLDKYWHCYYQMAKCMWGLRTNGDRRRSFVYLLKITSCNLFHMGNFMKEDWALRQSLGLKLSAWLERYKCKPSFKTFIHSEIEDVYVDSALETLGFLSRKNEILSDLHKFASLELPKIISNSKDHINEQSIIVGFVRKLYVKYLSEYRGTNLIYPSIC